MKKEEISFYDSGLDDFEKQLREYTKKVSEDKALDAIEAGAKEFVSDLLKLPKPRREVKAPGYIHLVDSFALEREKTQIKVGWGKYYGPMVEHGTKKMAKQEHLKPLFNANKDKYYKVMIDHIFD